MPIIISKEAQQFAKEIGEDDPLALLDIECGMHSGFPRCCILFFVKVWRNWMEQRDCALMDAYLRTQRALGVGSAGYVRCPACVLAGNAVPVKDCFCHRQRSFKLAS
jgi:hypothetical protein